jgi:hypothetical protein
MLEGEVAGLVFGGGPEMSGIHVFPRWVRIVLIAAIAACSDTDEPTAPLPSLHISLAPTGVAIQQGDSATLSASVGLIVGFSATPQVTITGIPQDVAARVQVIQSSSVVATVVVTIIVDAEAQPGAYSLLLSASNPGAQPASAPISLLVVEPPVPPPPPCASTELCQQWATSATASSEYTSSDWSAAQATGAANVYGCNDDPHAWASLGSDTKEWLEVNFELAVFPTKVEVFETFANSSIVKVELKDETGVYRTVFTAEPKSETCPRVLAIPVTNLDVKIKGVRIHFDQRLLAYWNEVDAVKLSGYRQR